MEGVLSQIDLSYLEQGWVSLTLFNITIWHQTTFKPAIPLVVEQLLLPAQSILMPRNTIQVKGP